MIKNSLNAVSFEANLEKQEKKKQLLDFIGEGVVPSNFLVNIGFNKINQKRNINLINLNKVFNKEIKLSDKDVKSYFAENKEKYKDLYKSIKFIELNSKNLTNNDQFTDLFFKKIDEIDDLIVEGNNLDFILQKYNLESFTTISLNEAGENKNSEIAKAMDEARGGYFKNVPNSYPSSAWYTYDDKTCNYSCQITEYTYWALTSILGAQEFPGRLEEIQHEWRLNTKEKVKNGDQLVYSLLTDPEFKFPTNLPNGRYRLD